MFSCRKQLFVCNFCLEQEMQRFSDLSQREVLIPAGQTKISAANLWFFVNKLSLTSLTSRKLSATVELLCEGDTL